MIATLSFTIGFAIGYFARWIYRHRNDGCSLGSYWRMWPPFR